MKNNVNYIFKRVVTFFIIFMILSFIKSCEVHAESYPIENQNTIARFYPSGTNSNLNWSTLYYNGTANIILNGWDFKTQLVESIDKPVLNNGRYLFSFYVYGVGTFRDLKCNEMSSNFKNVNMTTGNEVSNEITSKCLDIYRTNYHGYNAYRFLYEFTKITRTGPEGATEFNFTFTSGYNPIVGSASGMNYGFEVNNIEDYDINVINTWNTDKQQQTIINQGQTQIQQNETIINQQNQNTSSIINNNNTNTQSIINNQEQNTQEIIDNQNQNTQDMIDSQKVCENYNYTKDNVSISRDNYYLTTAGGNQPNNNYKISEYIPINKNINYNLDTSWGSSSLVVSYCIYDDNKTLISCSRINTTNITITSNEDGYIRYSISKQSERTTNFTGKYCKNGNQALVDSLTDDTPPNLDALNNSAGWLPAGPVDSILNLPLSLFNNLTTNLSKSCQSVTLPIPLVNENIVLPCVNTLYEQMGISGWINTIGVIASALILFSYLAKLYKWVDDTLTFRENNNIDNWGGI